MKDMLVIFITLLLLLTLISTFGGSIRFKETFHDVRQGVSSFDYEPIYKDTLDNVEDEPDRPPQHTMPIVNDPVIESSVERNIETSTNEEDIIAEPFVVSEEEQERQTFDISGYDAGDMYASF